MKFIYYLYYKIYEWSIRISDDFLNEIKPFVLIGWIEFYTFLNTISWFCYFLGIKSKLNKLEFLGLAVIIMIVNHYMFTYKDKWKKYSHEFQNYPKAQKKRWNRLIIIILIASFISIFFSLWGLKKVGYIPPYHAKNR